jgi:thioredoxin reductase
MAETGKRQKTVIVGAGPVGALAALYAAQRGHDVEVYELRSGAFTLWDCLKSLLFLNCKKSPANGF